MSIYIAATVALISLLVGVLIGSVGIGGVLLVPVLTYIGGIGIHEAIASCMLSYFFSGLIGTALFARRGSIRWAMCSWLCLGAVPGAFAGARSLAAAPPATLEWLIAGLVFFAGIRALMTLEQTDDGAANLQPWVLVIVGAMTGFGSALSGTGGPILLLPVLIWMAVPVLVAVGLSQVIQLPIAAFATAGNLLYGEIQFGVALGVAVLLMIGVVIGAHVAHAMASQRLRKLVALVLVATGVLMIARLIFASVL